MRAVLRAELGQDGLDVVADGLGTDMQLGRDLSVAATGDEQIEDLTLAAGQRMRV